MFLEKYSIGIGDRFAHQGKAQLQALINARANGLNIVPVWNKSHREHTIIKTSPADVRKEADIATTQMRWPHSYYVDADHISLKNVDLFMASSDFFTLDVADFIGQPIAQADIDAFIAKHRNLAANLAIPGIDQPLKITKQQIAAIAAKFLLAVKQAGKIYHHIQNAKGSDNFITEVSMDETDSPQTPVEMLFILAAIADERIPAQTIAPKFTGRFNKGVDYVGNVNTFTNEFEQDLAVIRYAVNEFSLPANLKLSVHSGSDKFSIYSPIAKALQKYDAGLHLKTAGTTWLEELIGLALAGGHGLEIAKQIYEIAFDRFDELCKPYASVIDIDPAKLPSPRTVADWPGKQYADTLRHDQSCDQYNPHFRQLLHVAYKVAAELDSQYLTALTEHENIIAQNVTQNIYHRHIKKVFIPPSQT